MALPFIFRYRRGILQPFLGSDCSQNAVLSLVIANNPFVPAMVNPGL